MTVRVSELKDGEVVRAPKAAPPIRRVIAAVAQGASYLTTLWAVQWVWDDGQLAHQIIAALVLELLLVGMKSALWSRNGDETIGWAGFAIDAIINAGGILPRAAKLLTWPPIASLLAVASINAAEPTVQTIGGFIIAAGIGILLSILPHRLWRG